MAICASSWAVVWCVLLELQGSGHKTRRKNGIWGSRIAKLRADSAVSFTRDSSRGGW